MLSACLICLSFLICSLYLSSAVVVIVTGIIEVVCQRLTDVFNKQPQSMQELLYSRFMSVKLSLYQSSTVTQLKAADCQAKLMLTGVAQAFIKILRPKAVSAQDKVSHL